MEKRDKNGETLIIAALRGQAEEIRELVKTGADIEARNKKGFTAFDVWQARHLDFQEISDLLRP